MQLSSANPGTTDEERSAWKDGLKALFCGLREEKMHDAGSVAAEIAAYRRRFVQEPLGVLPH